MGKIALSRRQFFAANAALAAGSLIPAAVECSHDDWDASTQTCRRCGTTLKQILLSVCRAAAKHAQADRLEDIKSGPFPRNFAWKNFYEGGKLVRTEPIR